MPHYFLQRKLGIQPPMIRLLSVPWEKKEEEEEEIHSLNVMQHVVKSFL
jgi:hypothetical protein